jgi:hypothetical protein
MAAGLGFKTFTTGEVLTAADVNGYLMQGVLVFASEAARDAAITSPQEGQFAFTKDNNSLWYYDSAAWVASGATGDIEGVTAGTGISGGGTSGTVTITNSMATEIDAAGDLVVGTGADTFARLAVGANDTVLTADSSVSPTGLKWAASAAGGLTQLATGTLSGAELTVSSISGSYKHLQIIVRDVLGASSSALRLRFNGDSGATSYKNVLASAFTYDESAMLFASQTYTSGDSLIWCEIPDYANTATPKIMRTFGVTQNSGTPNYNFFTHFNAWNNTAAINSVTFRYGSGNLASGTYFIYGVS